eukprot:3629779-Amphidinium_carterae.1
MEHMNNFANDAVAYDPPEELSLHCLYACLLRLVDAPATLDSLLQLRRAVQDVLAEAYRCDLEVAGFSLSQWLREDAEGVLNHIHRNTCHSTPTSSR